MGYTGRLPPKGVRKIVILVYERVTKSSVTKCRGSRVATKSRGSRVWVVGAGAGKSRG